MNEIPQFRTAFKLKSATVPLRIHFIHIKSAHAHAIPLLLIPSFPLTNLTLQPLFKPLLEDAEQPLHLVVPSIPGLGFSDAFITDGRVLEDTAEIFNALMRRLGYEVYVASSTGNGRGVDYDLGRLLGERWAGNCAGVHLLAPPLKSPELKKEPIMWWKFQAAKFFHAKVWGYEEEDWRALREESKAVVAKKKITEQPPSLGGKQARFGTTGAIGLREPNTLAYALCDSPVGLLSLVCSALRRKSPKHTLNSEEVINVTQLCWLPGPEAAMRFWASAASETTAASTEKRKRGRVTLTVFGSSEAEGYVCPAWGSSHHDIISAQRVGGTSGLLVFERPNVIIEGIRNLAKAVKKVDGRLEIKPLEAVVVGDDSHEAILESANEDAEGDMEEDHGLQLDVESPDTVIVSAP